MKKETGFSMVEIWVVLGILGIIAVFAIPSYRYWMVTYRVNAAARNLFSDMQVARMRAISERCDYMICFDTGNNGYAVYRDVSGNGLDAGDPCVKSVSIPQEYSGIGYGYVSATSPSGDPISSAVTFTGTPRRFSFQPTGLVNKWGSVYFKPMIEPYDDHKNLQRVITVILTGRIRLYRHNGTGWE